MFLTPVFGLVADRIGRRRTIIPLLLIFGVAGAAIAFVNDCTQVLILRFLQGSGASALVTPAVTLVGDIYDGAQRNAVIGVNGSTIGTGAAFYPLLGGALAAIRWSVPFLFFGVGILVGIFAFLVLDEPTTDGSMGTHESLGRLRAVSRLPSALAVFVAIFAAFFVFYGAVLTAIPLLLSDEFGLTASRIGPVLSMVSLASATVLSQYGRVSGWRIPPELIAIGFIAYGLSLLLVWAAPSPVYMAGSLLLFGAGFGIVMPSIDTTVITLVSDDLRAGMMGMRTSLLRLGQTLGPISFTFAAETLFVSTVVGYRFLLVTAGILVITAGSVGYGLIRR
ncbi:MAG: MFS transporter [Halobacteriales archaeon]